MNNLSKYLFAPQCIFCGRLFSDICIKCLSKCVFDSSSKCIECKNYSRYGITHKNCLKDTSPTVLYSIFSYEGLVADCIRRSKYHRKEFASLKALCDFGFSVFANEQQFLDGFVSLSVPLSKNRLKTRGFNQVDFITKSLSKRLRVNVLKNTVKRVKDTEAQYEKTKFERKKNLLGAFKITGDLSDKKILVVDDIMTTGSTMLELSKTLYNAGACEVRCFALSRVS